MTRYIKAPFKVEGQSNKAMQNTTLTLSDLKVVGKLPSGEYVDIDIKLLLEEEGGSAPIAPYKVYTALLTQTGTDAPVATVLENTLGEDFLWQRDDDGYYYALINSILNEDKAMVIVGASFAGGANAGVKISTDVNVGQVDVVVTTNNISIGDDELNNTAIEIRVYN